MGIDRVAATILHSYDNPFSQIFIAYDRFWIWPKLWKTKHVTVFRWFLNKKLICSVKDLLAAVPHAYLQFVMHYSVI